MSEVKIPTHVAIIMDGNGRWATERGLVRTNGHYAGYKNLKKLAVHILKKGVKVLSVFAFSTENFKRSNDEVSYLMNLFVEKLTKESSFFDKHNIKVIFSGRKEPLKTDVLAAMDMITKRTKDNDGGIFNVCLNYGGKAEIVDATKKIIEDVEKGKLGKDDITEEVFSNYLYQNLPPIDFVIRTSGEQRISNFMLYQAAYAEYYFPKTYFPDFDSKEFDKSLEEYTKRDRRFGGIKKSAKK